MCNRCRMPWRSPCEIGSRAANRASVRLANRSETSAAKNKKTPCEDRCCRPFAGGSEAEAPVGVEPTMADLQSAALATWLRSHSHLNQPIALNR